MIKGGPHLSEIFNALRRSLLKRFWDMTSLSNRQGQIKGSWFVGRDGPLIVCLQKILINHSLILTNKMHLCNQALLTILMKTRLQRKMLNFCSKNILEFLKESFIIYSISDANQLSFTKCFTASQLTFFPTTSPCFFLKWNKIVGRYEAL